MVEPVVGGGKLEVNVIIRQLTVNVLRLGDGYEALALCGGVACAKPLL